MDLQGTMDPHAGKNINVPSKHAFDKEGLTGGLKVHPTERGSDAYTSNMEG